LDVVIGVDLPSGTYVGIDTTRLRMGGDKANASSFFDIDGLSIDPDDLRISPHPVDHALFRSKFELHAFFRRSRLSEYLFNYRAIHSGLYAFGGAFNAPLKSTDVAWPITVDDAQMDGEAFVLSRRAVSRKPRVSRALVKAAENEDLSGLTKRHITPEELKRIMSVCDEIGGLGELAVLNHERQRLRKLGHTDQADDVERVSLKSVTYGYDIVSFEDDGITKIYF
jgi:hypothetical protein